VDKCKHWKNIFSVKNEEFVNETVKKGCIDLYYFADTLSQKLSDDSVVITDAGFEELIVPSTVQFHGKQRCLFPASQGAMGYAIPAVIGAYFAQKENIAVVVGDGSFMMNMQELLAISANKIPVKIFVIDNNMYAVIRKRQKDLFRTRTIGNDPSDGVASPNFRKIADAFGIKYEEVENPNELGDAIERVMGFSEPVICKVTCDREQKYLHTSFAINGSRKLVKRPIEDLSPFIEREIFYSEMMIKPLEE
jgi:acetolactate synthase-1/2/3 large subunit